MDKEKQLDLDIADAIIDRPKGFSVGRRHFYLYPITIGKMYLQKRIVDNLGINKDLLQGNPFVEALRLVECKKEDCCLLLAYNTLQSKKDVLNNRKVTIQRNIFFNEMSNEDIATLLIACISDNKLELFTTHLGIDKELERLAEVNKAKDNSSTLSFGGLSIYGTLIDAACERYKWTFDYVVWEISYINLHLLLRDSIKSVFLTDDEKKRVHINDNSMVDGNNKDSVMNVVKNFNWK